MVLLWQVLLPGPDHSRVAYFTVGLGWLVNLRMPFAPSDTKGTKIGWVLIANQLRIVAKDALVDYRIMRTYSPLTLW